MKLSKLSKLTHAMAVVVGVGAPCSSFALDLYVDTKTKQIYAEPGPGRQHIGSYEKTKGVDTRNPDKTEAAAGAAAAQTPRSKETAEEFATVHRELRAKTKEIAALQDRVNETEKVKVKLDDGIFHFESKDGNFKAAVNGRMQVDSQVNIANDHIAGATGNNLPNELNNGLNIRRARLGVEGTFYKMYDYKFEYDFSRGDGRVASGITDAYLRWNYSRPFSIKFGSFKEPFSLEEATSNRYLTFIERNMAVNTFVDTPNTYKTGIGANWSEDRWQAGVALQTEPIGSWNHASSSVNPTGNNSRNNGSGDTSYEVIGRLSFIPWKESESKFLHIGGSGAYTKVNNQYRANGLFGSGVAGVPESGMSFVAFPGTNVDRTAVLNTGNLTRGARGAPGSVRINNYNRYGAEAAFVYGPFSAQGEYIATDIQGDGYHGETLKGYYGYASYFLTGESRTYRTRTGAWDRIKPARPFDMKGGWGAWEIAAGYDYLNLNSGIIKGGRADMVRFGLNWYPHSHVRVMSNFIHVLNLNTQGVANARSAAFNGANLDIFEMRVQVDF